MACHTMLRGEHALPSAGIARIFEELPGPEITQQFAHLARLKMRRLHWHSAGVVPHRRGDLRQRPAFDPRPERRASLMARHTSFRLEDGFTVGPGCGFKCS